MLMNSLPRWLISITDMPLPCQSSISAAACCRTTSGSTAGPALKLTTRMKKFRCSGEMDTPAASDACAPRDRASIRGDRLFDQRRQRRELLILRHCRKVIVFRCVTRDSADQIETYRCQRALPQLPRRFALLDETPFLRGDRAGIHPFRQMVNRAARNGIALLDRPLDRGDAAVARQQRRVIADSAEPRARERFAADTRMGVRSYDEVGSSRNRRSGNDLGIGRHIHVDACRSCRVGKPIVIRRHDDAQDRDALFAQNGEGSRAKPFQANERDFHAHIITWTTWPQPSLDATTVRCRDAVSIKYRSGRTFDGATDARTVFPRLQSHRESP